VLSDHPMDQQPLQEAVAEPMAAPAEVPAAPVIEPDPPAPPAPEAPAPAPEPPAPEPAAEIPPADPTPDPEPVEETQPAAAPEVAPEPEPPAAPEPVTDEPPAPAAAPEPEPPVVAEVPEAEVPEVPAEAIQTAPDEPEPEGRPRRKRDRGDAGIDAGGRAQSARTGGLLTTASSRQERKALEEEAIYRRERTLDMYHAVESLCFYNAKEIASQMQVVDGALTVRVPHGPTVMRVIVADFLEQLPVHILGLRALSKEQREAWFPGDDTHWNLESANQLPGYIRRALTLLETLCEVAASGKHRRLYQRISSDAVNAVQDLAMLSALELASRKKIKRKIGFRGADDEETKRDAAEFLECARTAAQTLKAVCTLYEWRDQYVAAAAATYPPKSDRKPDGAPGSDSLFDAVVNAAFCAVRRATPVPSVGTLRSILDVAPARGMLAGAARLACVDGCAAVLARGGVDRLRPTLRLGLAAVRLAAAAPDDPAPAVALACARALHAGQTSFPELTPEQTEAAAVREGLLPVATHGCALLQTLLDLDLEEPTPFSFLDAAAADDGDDGCAALLAAAVGSVLRQTSEQVNAQTEAAAAGWRGEEGVGWVFAGDAEAEAARAEGGGMMAMMEAGGGEEEEAKALNPKADATDGTTDADGANGEGGEEPESPPEKLALPAPVGKGSGALILAAMRSAEALSVDSATQDATMEALAAPLARALALPEDVFKQWWCGGAAAKFVHGDDSDIAAAAAAAAADAGVQDGPAGVPALTQVTVNADPGCRIPYAVREELAKAGTLRVAERALLLHHLLGNLHIHDARTSDEFDRGKFLGLMVEELGGSRGHEEYAGDDGGRLGLAFRNLGALHAHVEKDLPAGTVAEHDVQIVRTLVDEWRCHLPGGGGAAAAASAAAASAAAAAAAAPKPKNDPDDAPISTLA